MKDTRTESRTFHEMIRAIARGNANLARILAREIVQETRKRAQKWSQEAG